MLPKNSPFGLLIAGAGFLMCFALIWHIWWLFLLGLIALFALVFIRLSNDETEYVVTKEMVLEAEKGKVL